MAEPVAMIGQTTFVRGNVRGQGSLTVAGRVEGNIEVDGDLVLEESSLVRCDAVTAQSVIARGAIAANITASESIVLEAGARVAGDLQAPKIRIEEGALFRGRIEMNGEARPQPTVRTARAAAPAQARPVAPPAAAPARVATPAPAPTCAARRPATIAVHAPFFSSPACHRRSSSREPLQSACLAIKIHSHRRPAGHRRHRGTTAHRGHRGSPRCRPRRCSGP